MRYLLLASFLMSAVAFPLTGTAQSSLPVSWTGKGTPFVQHYSTRDLGYDVTNWCVARDSRGMLWVGNSFGLLEYDGVEWRIVESPNNTPVYSVDCAEDGTVYFGLRGAFGRLRFDRTGKPTMELLSDLLPEDAPILTEFNQIHRVNGFVYFISAEAACRWDGEECVVLPAPHPIERSFFSAGRIYAQIYGIGLCLLRDDDWKLLPGGALFADAPESSNRVDPPEKIISLSHDPQGRLVVCSRRRGTFRHDGHRFEKIWDFSGVSDPLWLPTRGIRLPCGVTAIGSTHSGVYFFDEQGGIRDAVGEDAGLNGGMVMSLYADGDIIWAALDDGLVRIEWPGGALTRFGARRGVLGQVTDLQRFAGTVYAGTTQGLFSLRRPAAGDEAAVPAFQLLPSVRTTVYTLLDIGEHLLVGSSHGVYALDRMHRLQRISSRGGRALLPLHGSSDTLLVGHHRGLYYLIRDGERWQQQDISDQLEDFILSLAEAGDGGVWAGTAQFGVRHIRPGHGDGAASITSYGTAHGLPDAPIFVSTVRGRPLFINEERTLAFDSTRQRFYPDTAFLQRFNDPLPYEPKFLSEDAEGRIWMQLFESQALGYALPAGKGRLRLSTTPFRRVTGDVIAVYSDEDGVSWFGTDHAVYRYDPAAPHTAARSYATRIRRLAADGRTLYFGDAPAPRDSVIHVPAGTQHITIDFVSGCILLEENMLYRWRLEGYDSTWSTPTPWHEAEYSGLPAGDYVFLVQALGEHDSEIAAARIAINVAQHWYLRWWVLTLFFGGIALFLLVAAIRMRHAD
ncbi:MAG: triple tyrosine motif-containing protein [Bacteroidota bacterium]|nr:triple tyrosine motif-containing protein [Bacteroidota bacterium]